MLWLMRAFVWTAMAALAISTAGCPHKPTTPAGVPPEPSLEQDVARLTIPPGAEASAALGRLDARAERGEMGAAWARLHYLLDLFDDARFRRDDDSLELLARAMGSADPSARGPAATDAALAFLLVEADRVLAADRLHAGAHAARTLVEFDTRPPAARDAVFQRMVELKTVANGGGPLASNARLRLFGFCREAFALALRAPRRARLRVISFCLYPLYDSDPEPYFAEDAKRRPPPPHWQDLSEGMLALLGELTDSGGRLTNTGAALADSWRALIDADTGAWPSPYAPAALGVPTVDRAKPFDWTPLLAIGDGRAIASRDALVAQLRAALEHDDRATIAVSMYGRSAADSLYVVAGAAVEAGAAQLELAVAYAQRLEVPTGDYWFGRTNDGAVTRVGVLPVSLATMAGGGVTDDSQAPRALGWDPRRATLQLHLVVGRDHWQLVAPSGGIARIATGDGDPRAKLRAALATVRAAFPDEDGLIVVVEANATYAALISAITAASHDATGNRLFSRLALATAPPAAAKNTLARRIHRRQAAKVAIVPDAMSARTSIGRRCYQALLERSPKLSGELRLELRDGDAVVVSGSRNKKLRACALATVGAPMKRQQITSATVAFSPR